MRDAWILLAALAANALGMAWLALAMETHWVQAGAARPLTRGQAIALRVLGSAALVAALLACFAVDHATMAPLVWVMALAGAALLVAFTLAWRPHWLAPLARWLRAL